MKLRLGVAGAVIIGTVVWLAVSGLGTNLTYFLTPSELLAKGAGAVGVRLRLGGQVDPGTMRRDSATGTIAFRLTDGTASISVVSRGEPPELFREGMGAVVEGIYGRDAIFRADLVLVKHSADYRPPGPGEQPPSETVERPEDAT